MATVACVALWVAVSAAPQDPPPAGRSTMTGVYTAEQATAGETTYGNVCTGCHNLGSHSGPSFSQKWKGKPLFDLYEQINEKMPEDDPGSLTPAESAQIVAYLLKANGNPAGTQPLPTDAAELKKILIESK
jgi:mono/diheme cytochrome c family protein